MNQEDIQMQGAFQFNDEDYVNLKNFLGINGQIIKLQYNIRFHS